MTTATTKTATGRKPRAGTTGKHGRPTKLTPEVQAQILDSIGKGCTYEIAAQSAGIDRATMFRWKQRGETAEQPYCDFRTEIERAQAEYLATRIKIIKEAAEGTDGRPPDWKAAAWDLARRCPGDFGDRTRVDASVTLAQTHLSTAEGVAQVVAVLEAAGMQLPPRVRRALERAGQGT